VRLAQGSEERFEPGAVELGRGDVRRVFGRRTTRDKFSPPILEMRGEFLSDLALAGRRQSQRREA
jgi:hypothetical protein